MDAKVLAWSQQFMAGSVGSPGACLVTGDPISAMSDRTFCQDGNVPYLGYPVPKLLCASGS